jgi:hypothetical protein
MSTHVIDSDADRSARRRLWRFVLISAGIHLALMAVTSVGYVIHLVSAKPADAAAGSSATAAAAAPAPAARPADGAAPADPAAVPEVPKAKDRDSQYFGAPETDPKKLQSGPDSRPDLDALR